MFRKHPNVVKVIIFGSRAKGNYREGSDIDLAVVGVGLSFSQLMDLNVQIEDWDCCIKWTLWIMINRPALLSGSISTEWESCFIRGKCQNKLDCHKMV